MQDESRNTIIFLVCAVALFLAYQFFVLEPQAKRHQAETQHQAAIAQAQAVAATPPGGASAMHVPAATRQAALAASPRVPIATPSLKGSIALRGARIDDLFLTQYRETVDKNAPPVELLRPEGVPHAWFAEFGWTGQGVTGLPGYSTLWTLTQGSRLAPGQPIVLTYSNGAGLTFTRKIEVDDKFMFTVTETVANSGAAPVTLAPYATIQRDGPPEHPANSSIVHEGAVGATGLDKPTLTLIDYKDLTKKGGSGELPSKGGWLGITDKYWLAALIPSQAERITGQFTHTNTSGVDLFDANEVGQPRQVAPGQSVSETTRLFAGAKVVPLLRAYESQLGIPRFDDAVDWGRYFFWLTHPIFWLLEHIEQYVGAFGLSILVLTVVVRGLFFPLANKSYESMTKMKKVQPLMDDIRKRYADDPAKQQQEMLALYSREKVNPLAGCIPILFQIPVFYSLYKVLTVTIEMRQASFLWIHDLSARDPTTLWNLFGLIPWNPAHLPVVGGLLDAQLHIGLLPIVYGLSMWLSTAMNPPAPDPTQQRIFQLMPIFFTFIMAPFAVGLLIYWTWSNVLSILQQYVIMRRFKVDNPIDRIIRRLTGRTAPAG